VQGLGGGGLLSTAQSIIIGAFPPKQMGTAMAIFGVGVILGPTFGPVMGGFITDNFSWHWIFFINIPIGVAATFLSWKFVPDLKGALKPEKIDWWGILFLVIGIGSLQYILEEGGAEDWFESNEIIFFFSTAIVSLTAFVIRELSIDYAAVNLRLYKSSNLVMGNVLNFAIGIILNGSVFIFPLFVQVSLGWTATQTGAFMIPGAMATTVGMVLATRIIGKGMNPKSVMMIGLAMVSSFLILLSFSGPDSNSSNFFWPFILRGLGIAFMMMPVLSLAVSGLKSTDIPQATSLSNMLRQLGGAVGIAMINIYLNHQNADVKSNMIGNISEYNDATTERIAGLTQTFSSSGYSVDDAAQAANMMMNGLVTKQQFILTYSQGFMTLGLGVLLCVPLILLIKYKKGQKIEAMNEH
jgi:DHA2 family multidrug resistance protein